MSAKYGGRWCGEGDVCCGTVDAHDTANNRKDVNVCLPCTQVLSRIGIGSTSTGQLGNDTYPWAEAEPDNSVASYSPNSTGWVHQENEYGNRIVDCHVKGSDLLAAILESERLVQGRLDQSKDKPIDSIDI